MKGNARMKKEDISKLKPCTLEEIQQVMLDMLIDIAKLCDKHNISYWLSDGTLLGAVRHKGFIPWDDDIDIAMPYYDYKKFMEVAITELSPKYFVQNYETDVNYDNVVVLTKIRDKKTIFIEEYDVNYFQGAFIDIFVMNKYKSNDNLYKLKKEFFRLRSASKMNIYEFESFNKRMSKKILGFIFAFLSKKDVIKKGVIADENHKQEGDTYSYSFSTPMSIKYSFHEDDIFPLKKLKFQNHLFSVPNNAEKLLEIYYGNYKELPPEDKRITHSKFYGFLIDNQENVAKE